MADREKALLWDYFCISQSFILGRDELRQWNDFILGKVDRPPFAEGSRAMEVVKLCGKIPG